MRLVPFESITFDRTIFLLSSSLLNNAHCVHPPLNKSNLNKLDKKKSQQSKSGPRGGSLIDAPYVHTSGVRQKRIYNNNYHSALLCAPLKQGKKSKTTTCAPVYQKRTSDLDFVKNPLLLSLLGFHMVRKGHKK